MNVQRVGGIATAREAAEEVADHEGEQIWLALNEVRYDFLRTGGGEAVMDAIRRRFDEKHIRRSSSEIDWADICRYIQDKYLKSFVTETLLPMPGRDFSTNERIFGEQAMLMERAGALFSLFEEQPWGKRGLGMLHDVSNVMLAALSSIAFAAKVGEGPSGTRPGGVARPSFDLSTISSLFQLVRMINKSSAEEAGVSMKTNGDFIELAEDVRFDLFRIVNELTVNAVKFSAPEKEERIVYLKSTPAKDRLQISVEDNGLGIEDVERAVMSGVRLNPNAADGDGMGLYNVCDIAEQQAWDFDIQSVPGFGSTMTIAMPMHVVGARLVAGI